MRLWQCWELLLLLLWIWLVWVADRTLWRERAVRSEECRTCPIQINNSMRTSAWLDWEYSWPCSPSPWWVWLSGFATHGGWREEEQEERWEKEEEGGSGECLCPARTVEASAPSCPLITPAPTLLSPPAPQTPTTLTTGQSIGGILSSEYDFWICILTLLIIRVNLFPSYVCICTYHL